MWLGRLAWLLAGRVGSLCMLCRPVVVVQSWCCNAALLHLPAAPSWS